MKYTQIAVGLMLVGMLSLTGCAADEAAQAKAPVKTTEIKAVEVFGKVQADEVIDISFEEPVKAGTLLAREGESLKKGQAIMNLDLRRLNGRISALSASYGAIQAMNNDQDIVVNRALQAEERARKDFEQSKTEYERQKALLETGAVSKADYDLAATALSKAQDAYKAAGLEVSRVKAENERKAKDQNRQRAEVDNNISGLNSIVASCPDIKGNLLVSRFDHAVMSDIKVLPGQYVEAGTSICHITNLDTLYVLADVPEEFIKNIKPGMKAEISPTVDKQEKYTGTVELVWNTSIEKNGETMIPVRIRLDQYQNLKPNYNVDVAFKSSK